MLKSTASTAASPAKGVLAALFVACCVGGGGWVGYVLKDSATAVQEVIQLREEREQYRHDIKALTETADELRQHAIDAMLAHDQAAQRLDAVAAQLETTLERDRKFDAEQRKALDALLGQRPDLRALRLGHDVLQHWNRSNHGADAATSAAGSQPAGKPQGAVPIVPAGDR
jgi:hypothetical protein